MRKLLLFFSILTSIYITFLPSEVLAVCNFCQTGTPTAGDQCLVPIAGRGGSTNRPKTSGCAATMQQTTTDPKDAACQCVPAGTTGAAGAIGTIPAAPGTGATTGTSTTTTPVAGSGVTTGGRGLPCNIVSGALENGSGIMTAIGCIPTQPQKLVEGLLWYGTLASGGVAFILMLLASIQMITAEGNPNTIKTAQERFYSAIIGLLIIVFSVLLMQVIGVDILGLKGFGK